VTGAGHILHDHIGVARNMLRHMLGKSARVKIVKIPRYGADDNRNGLSLIVGCLSVRNRAAASAKKKHSSDGYH
jgi:hypothetical protein